MRTCARLRTLSRHAVLALAAVSLLVAPTIVAAPRAAAAPGFPGSQPAFGATPSEDVPVVAMAGDGTVVVGRDEPGPGGGVQVQVRRPGGAWGATTLLERGAAGVDPWSLQVVGGPTGAVAAVWDAADGRGYRVSVRAAGAGSWSAPRATGVRPAVDGLVLDSRGRLWVAGVATSGAAHTRVDVFGTSGGRQTLDLPLPTGGLRDGQHQLVVGADGVGRLAYTSERYVAAAPESSCTYAGALVVADLRPGATPRPRTLESRSGVGGGRTGACFVDRGDTFADVRMVAGSDGTATLLSSVVQHPAGTTTLTARRARPGAAWPASGRAAVPAAVQTLVGAAAVGTRVVAVLAGPRSSPSLRAATQAPTGAWAAPRTLTTTATTMVRAAGGRRGGLLAWRDLAAPYAVHARALTAVGGLGPAGEVAGAATTYVAGVGVDDLGNGAVAHLAADGAPLRVLPYDGAGPRLTKVVVKRRVKQGATLRLRAQAVDTWSRVRGYQWRIGGQKRKGRTVKVTLRKAGRVAVVLKVTDTRGNTTTVRRNVRVVPRRR